ncbi:hypothetical protein [Haloferula sp. BvORR071]|uniref:hypothetical protein n=1 Tax=Haloferula sp. BvORR071 TaxID=1396141 RepID=UPI000551B0D6|nr:hypothetical protein [Haloferula sp. BvORR071]
MKPSLSDHLTILCALLTVFACGFGAGHLSGKKEIKAKPEANAYWEVETLSLLKSSLDLDPREKEVVETEIKRTATDIRLKREETILVYHEKISELYERLIAQLGDSNASRLKEEKRTLDEKIQKLRPTT